MGKLGLILFLVLIMSVIEVSAESLRVGDTIEISDSIGIVIDETVNSVDHIKELYGLCALEDPEGNVVWSEDSVSVVKGVCNFYLDGSPSSCNYESYCDVSWTFDKEGLWKLKMGIGYIDKRWDYTTEEWIIDKGIISSESVDISGIGIPSPPETSQELLKKLFDMFLNSF